MDQKIRENDRYRTVSRLINSPEKEDLFSKVAKVAEVLEIDLAFACCMLVDGRMPDSRNQFAVTCKGGEKGQGYMKAFFVLATSQDEIIPQLINVLSPGLKTQGYDEHFEYLYWHW